MFQHVSFLRSPKTQCFVIGLYLEWPVMTGINHASVQLDHTATTLVSHSSCHVTSAEPKLHIDTVLGTFMLAVACRGLPQIVLNFILHLQS